MPDTTLTQPWPVQQRFGGLVGFRGGLFRVCFVPFVSAGSGRRGPCPPYPAGSDFYIHTHTEPSPNQELRLSPELIDQEL